MLLTQERLRDLADPIVDSGTLNAAVVGLARKVSEQYTNEPVVLWCVLRGGIVVTGLLLPHVRSAMTLDYVHATRYVQNEGGSDIQWVNKPEKDMRGKHVLICDDIFDEGLTLQAIVEYARTLKPLSVRSLVLCNKNHQRKPYAFKPDFVGLDVPDRYVFGSGMDFNGWWRNAPGIWALKSDAKVEL